MNIRRSPRRPGLPLPSARRAGRLFAVVCVSLLIALTLAGESAADEGAEPGSAASPVPIPSGAQRSPSFAAARTMAALAAAYPGRVALSSGAGGTVLVVDGERFAWAEGRLLPESLAASWAEWAAQPFYPYPAREPELSSWSPAQLEAAESRLAERRSTRLKRSSAFFDALWRIHGRASAEERQSVMRFMGKQLTVHEDIVPALRRVEARLAASAAGDLELRTFLAGVASYEGYVWRDIDGTESRSNHAYGIAVDVLPKSFGGKTSYWLWAARDEPGWLAAAWARRWKPPASFVAAFEAEGFIWGGKWLYFDTMHFEYRPEILYLGSRGGN